MIIYLESECPTLNPGSGRLNPDQKSSHACPCSGSCRIMHFLLKMGAPGMGIGAPLAWATVQDAPSHLRVLIGQSVSNPAPSQCAWISAGDGPGTRFPTACVGDPTEAHASWLELGPALSYCSYLGERVTEWKISIHSLSLCLSNKSVKNKYFIKEESALWIEQIF